jgi:hypothetical protein
MVDAWLVRGIPTESEMLFDRARSRVERSPRLRPYADIILCDNWSPWFDHLRWVIRGRVGEIESWAKQIKEASDG